VKFDIGGQDEKLSRKPEFGSNRSKYRAVYMKKEVKFVGEGDIKLPYKSYLRKKWSQAVRIGKGV
jgi:hypothetical protein